MLQLPKVVIPSARADNLIPCVQSVRRCQPDADIIVVDDGARAEAEKTLLGVDWVKGASPFIFARNVNLGIVAAGDWDVVLMNDDARLATPDGFRMLAPLGLYPELGVCSASIRGFVCNQNQLHRSQSESVFRREIKQLAFICVYIPRKTIDAVGLLDERFTGYGYDDFDYCRRVKAAGYELVVHNLCVVEHSSAPSTYRTRPDFPILMDHNRRLYDEKWAENMPKR